MCGIVGLYHRDRGRAVSADALRTMCDAIVHRGPDDEGYHVDANVGMGMRRLSIIDREGGHQPVFNEDRQVSVVFNGEIYNHKDLRSELEGLGHRFRTRSDTEVLVHGYEQWGIDLPKRLNGMFAFSIWDRPNRRAMIARDHLGIKPLYVYRDTDRFAWASEIKALLTLPGIERNVNHAAVLDFLRYGYVPAPRTMFEGISKVEPGTVTVLEGDQVRTTSYWALRFPDAVNRSEDSWCEEIRELVDDSVQRQLMSDVPLGAFLSGGVDSSAIVATMSRLGVNRISTYAIGFGGEDAFHNELDKAQIIARQFNTDHHEIVVEPDVAELMPSLIRHLDEPFTDTSFIVTYLVSKLARESVTVILSGVGGDEIFAGYRRYLGPRLQNIYQWVPSVLRRRMIAPVLGRLPIDRGSAMKAVFRYARGFSEQSEFPEPLRYQGYVSVCNGERSELLMPEMAELDERFRSEQVADFYSTAECDDALNRMMYADIKSSLVDSLLAFTDKMSMAVSLEARVPLLDYRLVECAARVPPGLRLKGFSGMKYIFKRAMQDRLPETILRRKKQGFGTPISRWIRGSLRPMIEDLLSPQRVTRRGYFRPDAVRALIDDHVRQRADRSEHIMALLALEIWHEVFIDQHLGCSA